MLDKLKHEEFWQYYVPDNIFEYYGACFSCENRAVFLEEMENIRNIEQTYILPFTEMRVIDFVKSKVDRDSEPCYGSDGEQLLVPKAAAMESEVPVDEDKFLRKCQRKLKGLMHVMIYLGYPINQDIFLELYEDNEWTMEWREPLKKEQYEDVSVQLTNLVKRIWVKDDENLKKSVWNKDDYERVIGAFSNLEEELGVWDEMSADEKRAVYLGHRANAPVHLTGENYNNILKVYACDYFMNTIQMAENKERTWYDELHSVAFDRMFEWAMTTSDGWKWYQEDIARRRGRCDTPYTEKEIKSMEYKPQYTGEVNDSCSQAEDSSESSLSSVDSIALRYIEKMRAEERREEEEAMNDFLVDDTKVTKRKKNNRKGRKNIGGKFLLFHAESDEEGSDDERNKCDDKKKDVELDSEVEERVYIRKGKGRGGGRVLFGDDSDSN